MPTRQKRLQAMIETEYNLIHEMPQRLLLHDFVNHDEYKHIYHAFGGTLDEIPCGMREYDISTPNFNLELDEEQHFNRFREFTLTSLIYGGISNFPTLRYATFCRQCENACRTDGRFGHSRSSDAQYQAKSLFGQDRDNMTRWKQRAFYDYLKDSLPLITGKPLIRISIYEKIAADGQTLTVGYILGRDNYMDYKDNVLDLLKSRI